MEITESIKYVGVDDKEMKLFENQYNTPNGISYNSYIILDEKIAIMDTVDKRATDEWIANIETILGEKEPDYLIVSHMESDHSDNIANLVNKYPKMKVVGNLQIFKMIKQFFNMDLEEKAVVVKEGDTLNLGKHTLKFIMAPMVHWPEVMMTYEQCEKILFSADGFGKFGTLDIKDDWLDEARRYYINIVGKYGINVQAVLKKAANLDIKMICPLHGPILTENLGYYIDKYNTWSSYTPEEDGILIAYASIHGNTENAVMELANIAKENNKIKIMDLTKCDIAEAVSEAFKYSKLVVAASTYDSGVFPPMEHFLLHLLSKNYQNRKVGIIENGSWAPLAGKVMKEYFSKMKNVNMCDTMVTIRSAMNEENLVQMNKLVEEILNN